MATLNALLEMGFSQTKAEKALAASGDKGVEAAMEWLLEHNDDEEMEVESPIVNEVKKEDNAVKEESASVEEKTPENAADAEVKSYKCLDCNKQFKSDTDLEFHAVKSGHVNFAESSDDIRPPSEEEKEQLKRDLQERMRIRREERLEREKKEAIELEKNRRRMGQEIALTKQKLEEQEMKRIAEEKRREKLEAKLARQKVLEQIERDKQARREKFGGAPAETVPKVEPIPIQPLEATQPKKEYDQCRIQIRLTNGQALTQSFKPQEELAAVRLYVQMNRTDGSEAFSLMTNFPKKIFTDEDMGKPLSALGLVPTAVLIVRKGSNVN